MDWRTLIVIFICLFLTAGQSVADDNPRQAYEQLPVLFSIKSPFMDQGRDSFEAVSRRLFSRFGVYRATPKKGHRHSGIDLRGTVSEKVYAIGPGLVVRDYWIFPNRAVAVMHRLPDNRVLYSAYVHIQDIKVREGQVVDENSELGRLFNDQEMGRSRYRSPPHLHLEIRRSMADDGRRSFSSMTISSLQEYCLDPEPFLRSTMR